jgi:nitrogen-specific signal transduction histidine kinase
MQAYARLARLPQPSKSACAVPALIQRVVALEQRLPVVITGGPNVTLPCDAAQIEQVLINLTKNAVEAVLEHHAAEGGASTLITRRGRPVAVLAPVNGLAGQCGQASLLPVRGSGQGLWGPDIAETLAAARSEWDR